MIIQYDQDLNILNAAKNGGRAYLPFWLEYLPLFELRVLAVQDESRYIVNQDTFSKN